MALPSKNVFLSFIEKEYYDMICNRVKGYVVKFKDELILDKLPDVKSIFELELEDLSLENVYFSDDDFDRIKFDITVCASFSFSSRLYKYGDIEADGRDVYLTLECIGNISDSFKTMKFSVNEYTKNNMKKPMNDYFVPILTKEKFREVANEIIKKYYYNNYKVGESIDINKLSKSMGLTVEKYHLADTDVLGQIFFDDCEANVMLRGEAITKKISKNTIIVNLGAPFFASNNSHSLTIAHECVHFYLHKKAYDFAKMLNANLCSFDCNVNNNIQNIVQHESYKFLEIQANGVAPYLLLPNKTLVAKTESLIKLYTLTENSALDYFPFVIRDLAEYFNTSIYATKKRLIELGYKIAYGVLEWCDDRYIKSFKVNGDLPTSNETYTIAFADYIKLFNSNYPPFLATMANGDYVFVDNHLCLNSKKYVKKVNGEYFLTDYALNNIDECCLKFYVNAKYKGNNITSIKTEMYLCRDSNVDLTFDIGFNSKNQDTLIKNNAEFFKQQQKIVNDLVKDINMLSLCDALNLVKKRLGDDTKEYFSEEFGPSPKTVYRYFSGDNKKPDKKTLCFILHGMQLHPNISFALLNRAGIHLISGQIEDDALNNIVLSFRGKTIQDAINFYKLMVGVDPF